MGSLTLTTAGSPTLAVVDGRVADRPDPAAPALDVSGLVVLPGLLDLQVNGAAGIDLTHEPGRLWEVAAALPAYGVTAFVPTLISCGAETRAAALAVLAERPVDFVGAEPLGWHFEGPLIASERRGAHPAARLVGSASELPEVWSREAGVRLVTLAPELPGAIDLVGRLTAAGVVVSLGHTDADTATTLAALDAGAVAVTHLGNAMPPLRAREPGPVGVALVDPRVTAGVIADGHHHHPASLRLLWRDLGPERFLAVSDTTAALGMPPGPARLGDQQVVLADGAVRLADGTLAGSAASVLDCLAVLARVTGLDLQTVAPAATTTPARLVGELDRGRLEVGARGDLVVVDPSGDSPTVVATVVGGVVVHETSGSER